jgi:pyruvate/2-oxoglutarate dehydrogenase complex dihydrolipoamide dehydrogenase (E3) component
MAGGGFDLVIVGMGSAGVIAAEFAASLGVRVAAVERDRVGGDCLWTGCVPSKALLAAAHTAHAIRTADRFGIEAAEPAIDTAKVLTHVRGVQTRIGATDDDPERFRALGVDVRVGEAATLAGPHAVQVGDELLEARRVLLCPGSKPAVPPVTGLDAVGYLTSESVWEIERAPASLLILGGGPIAVELAQAFARLGVAVTLLELGTTLLARDEPELARRLTERLRAEGVRVELGAEVDRASGEAGTGKTLHAGDRSWTADEILVATGRRADLADLGLETVGLACDPRTGTLAVDARSRTRQPWLYAVGDVTGGYQFTHAAAADAAGAVRDMFLPGRGRSAGLVPWATFTDPELAHVGLTTAEARERHGDDVEVHSIELSRSDRARAEHSDAGLLVAVTAKDRLVGAHALAPAAGELIGELTLAISQGMKLSALASVVHVYPTYATSIAQLSAESAFAKARRYRRLVRT